MAKKIKLDWGKITSQINTQEKGYQKQVDERLFVPKLKDDGTAQLVLRFLWSPDTDIPFVKQYSHGFKNVGGWYIENCPTTIGKECPVCKANTVAWNSGDQATARNRARRLSCYANILIVKDPQTPENNGKVFLYRYGKKIHEKLMAKISPPEDGVEESVMIFDPYEGANFKLIIKKVKVNDTSFSNYDSSTFAEKTKIGTDAVIEKVDGQLYKLSDYVALDSFKSYDELAAKFQKVIGSTISIPTAKAEVTKEETESAPGEAVEGIPAPGEATEQTEEQFFSKLREGAETD